MPTAAEKRAAAAEEAAAEQAQAQELAEQEEAMEAPALAADYPHTTIYQRMIAILYELPAIGKNQRNTQQNFNFRGHDDVLNALTPLLAKHGVVIVPNVIERTTSQREVSGNRIMFEVNLHVEFTCYGAGGDSIVGSAWGEGTDMGDKSTMKAGTMAFKAFLNQTFAISTEEGAKHDADKGTPEETVRQPEHRQIDEGPKPPQNWAEAFKRFDGVTGKNGDGPAWAEELCEVRFNETSLGALSAEDRRKAWTGFVATLLALEDRHGDLSLTPGQRAIISGAFAEFNEGKKLEGPAWPLDGLEAEALAAEEGLSGEFEQERAAANAADPSEPKE